ncbi:sn-glycerol-3-phosphate transport system permease protein UgpE [Streptomyces sulfonofaciens]|uniref:Sn-glycerol-3-phosphate transport system permease protein UgpE n=1 Tax=Streptomyces sulfonofaciens TaxID=68272 RepID=A0A919FTA9_9ACTN|nr:carbohydrate ABC transporter permease [Streptomyces sulfonofaciens]GHH71624.1 sn-glycerol-3-phosphate transport system permease protein UgpE [Streptomyces sulfonofaciens]
MTRTPLRRTLDYLVLSVLAFIFVLPALYLFLGSFKPSDQVLSGLSGFLPTHLTLHNYRAVLAALDSDSTGYFWHFMGVSLLLAAVVVLGGLVVNSMAAYGLTRLRWRGSSALFALILLLMLVPFEAVAVPLFYLLNGARNTLAVQAVPFVANAFSIYQFATFFRALPVSIEEAARIDGAGPWRTFFAVVIPMSRPVFASVAILTFLTQWGSFLWPVLMVSDPSERPLPLELSVFQGQQPPDWGQILAFGVLLVLPVLIVFAFFQRWFVQGVAGSAVKG